MERMRTTKEFQGTVSKPPEAVVTTLWIHSGSRPAASQASLNISRVMAMAPEAEPQMRAMMLVMPTTEKAVATLEVLVKFSRLSRITVKASVLETTWAMPTTAVTMMPTTAVTMMRGMTPLAKPSLRVGTILPVGMLR